MREFTKSMMSYTWAMSLFGIQQMANAFRPSQATESFDNVTQATREEFGEALKATFRAGDNLQRGLVDLTFSVFTLGTGGGTTSRATSDLGQQSAEVIRQGMRAAGQAADAVGQTVQGAAGAAADAARQGAGWAAPPGAGRDAASYAPPGAPGFSPGGQAGAAGTSTRQTQSWGPMPSQASGSSKK